MVADYFLTQKQQVALALEAVEGSPETLADADVIAPVFDVEYVPEVTMNERAAVQASLSRITQISGEQVARIRFSTELKGSGTAGTAPPNLSAPLEACGFKEAVVVSTSVTYTPQSLIAPSAEGSSATVEVREIAADGTAKVKQIKGARGTVSFVATKGNPVMAVFEFLGVYVEPTEDVALTDAAVTPLPEPFLSATFSFQAASLLIQGCTLDMANNLVMRNDVSQASGNIAAAIAGRTPAGSIDPEQTDIATYNAFNKLTTDAEGSLSYALGVVAGNIMTVTAPKAQIVGLSEADRDAIRTLALDLALNRNAAAGDDELSIAFT